MKAGGKALSIKFIVSFETPPCVTKSSPEKSKSKK
jgi:hypothetical protein